MTVSRLRWTTALPQRPGYYLMVEYLPVQRATKHQKEYVPPAKLHAGLVVDYTDRPNNDYWIAEGFHWHGAGKSVLGWDNSYMMLSPATRSKISGKLVGRTGSSVKQKTRGLRLWFARVPGIPERTGSHEVSSRSKKLL